MREAGGLGIRNKATSFVSKEARQLIDKIEKDIDTVAIEAMWHEIESQKERLGIKDNNFATILVSFSDDGFRDVVMAEMAYGGKEGFPYKHDFSESHCSVSCPNVQRKVA